MATSSRIIATLTSAPDPAETAPPNRIVVTACHVIAMLSIAMGSIFFYHGSIRVAFIATIACLIVAGSLVRFWYQSGLKQGRCEGKLEALDDIWRRLGH